MSAYQMTNDVALNGRPFVVMLLAGALHPSPLRRSLDVPALCLPLRGHETLLDLWLSACSNTPGCRGITIAVSSASDAAAIERQIESSVTATSMKASLLINITIDEVECRGPGGVLLQHSRSMPLDDGILVVGEASSVPPEDFSALLNGFSRDRTVGVVGGTASYKAAGLYAFSYEAVSMMPDVMYLDIKEQVLPHLYRSGMKVQPAIVTDRALGVRSREQYLHAVRHMQCLSSSTIRDSHFAKSARLFGTCLIGENVIVEEGAVVHESILLPGAQCGVNSIVARSIVGHGGQIRPRSIVKDSVIDRSVVSEQLGGTQASQRRRRVDLQPFSSQFTGGAHH